MIGFLSAFNWYGFIIATGIVLGVLGAYIAATKRGMQGEVIFPMLFCCFPLAIVGARLYHVFFSMLEGEHWSFLRILGVEDKGLAGLAIYGGVIGCIAGAGIFHAWLNRKKVPKDRRVSFWQILDLGFTFMLVGQAIGRWGNFANGEDYGYAINNPAWQWFPFGVQIDGEWRYALFFYESLWNLIGFGLLLYSYLGRFKSFDGFNFAGYCIIYGVGRSWIESLRDDGDVLMLGSARVSLLVSLLFIVGGLAIIITHIVRAKKAGRKVFIFVEKSKLSDEYFGYEKTKLAHPMPDIVPLFGGKKKSDKESYFVDESGVAIKTADADDAESAASDTATENRTATCTQAEEKYEDNWD